MNYYVEVKEFARRPGAKDPTVKTLGPLSSERAAERVERGLLQNLNRTDFYTVIVDENGRDIYE